MAHAEVPGRLSRLEYVPPEALVDQALKQNLLGISFTYNQPAIWFEYTLNTFRLAKARALVTNYVTNGSLTTEALDQLGPYLDAYRVDIKGFSEETYRLAANFPKFQDILDLAARAKTNWGMHVGGRRVPHRRRAIAARRDALDLKATQKMIPPGL